MQYFNTDPKKLQGSMIIAQSLKDQGVEHMFGIVGVPVMEVALAAQMVGIKFYGMRNEQAASYAAGAVGYMTGRPGCCLTVSGPGVIHAIAGISNAWSNCWPMIVIGGASDSNYEGSGGFQECPQVQSVATFTKYHARPNCVERIPFHIEKAVKSSIYGRPGPVYVDFPQDLITRILPREDITFVPRCPPPPRCFADPTDIGRAVDLLKSAKSPLVIVGKGAAYAHADKEVRALVERTGFPYLATPMGKGVIPDDHSHSIAPARSHAIGNADVILLVGARLNWMLHFGLPPRFKEGVKIVQIEIAAEEFHNNVPTSVALCGDAKAICGQLEQAFAKDGYKYPSSSTFWSGLRASMDKNNATVKSMMQNERVPMSYYRVFKDVSAVLPRDCIIVSEGANTMDIGRTIMKNFEPRSRLDAGTFGTMGIGLGFAIAGACVHPNKKIVCVEGDSAFGFSAMEFEVCVRFNLNITFIVINNNGIYAGSKKLPKDMSMAPATSLSVDSRYDKITEVFGGEGYFVTTPSELLPTLQKAMAYTGPSVVNILIATQQERKPQKHDWLTPAKKKSETSKL